VLKTLDRRNTGPDLGTQAGGLALQSFDLNPMRGVLVLLLRLGLRAHQVGRLDQPLPGEPGHSIL
jgi:hypothetical protein